MVFTKTAMPAGTGAGASNNTGPGARTTFRPPWVKETPSSTPVAPWTINKKGKETQAQANAQSEAESQPVRKTSKITIVPSQPNENGTTVPQKPATNARLASREVKVPIVSERKVPVQRDDSILPSDKSKTIPVQRTDSKQAPDRSSKVIPVQIEDSRPKSVPVRREDSKQTDRPRLTAQNAVKDADNDPEPENKFRMVKLRETTPRDPESMPVKSENKFPMVKLREVSKDQENNVPVKKESKFPTVKLRETSKDAEIPIPVKSEKKFPEVKLRETKNMPPLKEDVDNRRLSREDMIPLKPSLVKQGSMNKIPPPPPMAPPMPPPPPKLLPQNHSPLSEKQAEVLESLRARPRRRPDWATMMKEVEEGKKLKHVVCNDRSKPVLPAGKTKTIEGKFIYESEKSNLHNQLLKQIQNGINLKSVQTNDRSKPILDGLRKFRRQMTIEEQIQKSQSMVTIPDGTGGEIEVLVDDEEMDEMDDIDKVRDDLQSTKQLLALEMRNKEAQVRENKRLQARILNLETELDRARGKAAASVTRSVMAERIEDEKLVANLKQEADEARKAAKDMEKKYLQASDLLDTAKGDLEEQRRQNAILEKRLEQALKMLNGGGSRRESQAVKEGEVEIEDEQITESDSDEGEDTEEKKEKRAKKELKLLTNKLRNFKDKESNARKERIALKEQMKQQQELIKEERKKFKALQREVDKMAAMMKDDECGDEEKEEKEDGDDEENENEELSEEESETESESESSSESEEEQSHSESEEAPFEKRKDNYSTRVRRHENCLAALKKGNYLLKANIDRLKEDLNKQREDIATLQEDLDSVLAELG